MQNKLQQELGCKGGIPAVKDRSAFFAGLSLFGCLCLLVASGSAGKVVPEIYLPWVIMAAEIIAFGAPLLLLLYICKNGQPLSVALPKQTFRPSDVRFVIVLALACFFVSFFANFVFLRFTDNTFSDWNTSAIQSSQIGKNPLLYFIAVALIPAIVEEFLMRGPIQYIFSQNTETGSMLFFCGLVFAMLHGSLLNFIGPLICGISYAWLFFVYRNVWPAVIAHAINNALYLFVLWLTDTYGAYGIWKYVPSVSLILFLLFGYLTLKGAESLLEKDRIPRFRHGKNFIASFIALFGNPASLAFLAAFIIKTVYDII